jgi:hypothetical protein
MRPRAVFALLAALAWCVAEASQAAGTGRRADRSGAAESLRSRLSGRAGGTLVEGGDSDNKTSAAEEEALERSFNAWQLWSGRKLACGDVVSPRMKSSLRHFKKVWTAAYGRMKDGIVRLEQSLRAFAEEASTAEHNITNPIDPRASDADKVAALKRLTETNFPIVQALTQRIDARLGTKSRVSIKTDTSILNKAHRPSILAENPWFAVEHIRDSLRFMTAVRDVGEIAEIVGLLVEARIRLVKIDVAKLLRPKKWGWRFVAFDLRMENGQICEYYLTFDTLARVMFDTHRIYERWRQASVGDRKARNENPGA